MRHYRTIWRTCWAALALLLLLAGLVLGSAGAILVTGVLAGLLGAVAAAALLQNDGGVRVPVSEHGRVAGRFGLRAGAVVGVLGAWAEAAGSLVPPLLVAAAVTSPPVVAALLGADWRRRPRGSGGAVHDDERCGCGCADPVSAEEVRVLLTLHSDAELVRSWRHSLTRLHQARSAAEWSGLVALRTACLAELEDRDPIAFRRWLDSRPPPATAPELARPTEGPIAPVVPPPEP
ncbi:hypothetical protein ENKNEFLB_00853 [Nocardioides aquaticus]|uniref:Uncharacterized protein n=1 Tax=Nocardioides aquaticus TaxID=160826 RepID=A0ABX8EDX8_9ACTN|nr:hypothetical protein [Nocardioides aquaticus]QVT78476.1 hypothetical protein ENKNEFLB_00853 [Nocardioides aquaticus]